MRKFALSVAVFLVIALPAAAQTQTPTAAVQAYVAALNKGDMAAAAALCERPASIVDDFPPHIWQGTNACAQWGSAFEKYNAANGITNGIVTLGKPWHADVSGDRAYVVVPATFTYEQHRKPVVQSGCVFTLSLRKTGSAWRITGWAWADR